MLHLIYFISPLNLPESRKLMSVKGDVIKAGGRVTPRAALKMRGHSVQSQSLTVPMRGDT